PGYDFSYKINMAYVVGEERGYPGGGAQLAKDTVSSFIGQPVQYYVRVNFRGFVELVDLIDGVEVAVPLTIHDEQYPTADYGVETFHLDGGIQHLDGETALKYARTRNVDSDYGRARRQQQIIRAVADKVLRADMLPTLLPKAPRLLYTMRSSIETDIPMAMQLELANYMGDSSIREIRQLVLDQSYGEETYSSDGAWILLPDRARVRTALGEFFGDAPASAANANHPEWVRIEILNGTDQPGVAPALVSCWSPKVGRWWRSAMQIAATMAGRSSSTMACPMLSSSSWVWIWIWSRIFRAYTGLTSPHRSICVLWWARTFCLAFADLLVKFAALYLAEFPMDPCGESMV
ncbi:MAG: LCP family protein, partial [Caldilineaceae bacterium]|nr:LCP family protein [Caldilineaceae bacterium]